MLKFLRRLLFVLFAAEFLYLLVANVLLNTDLLQQRLSRNPDRLVVDWKTALTPLPGIYWLSDLSLRIQTPRSQAYLEAASSLGQIRLLQLPKRQFQTRWLQLNDLKIYLRPRPREQRPLQDRYIYFPPIPHALVGAQDQVPAAAPESTAQRPQWVIALDSLQVNNLADAWLWNYRFRAQGSAAMDVRFKTRDRLQIENGEGTLQVDTLQFNDRPVTGPLEVAASFKIDPYLPREHRGIKMLSFVSGEFDISGRVSSLGFIDYHLRDIPWLQLQGAGDLNARLVLEKGQMLDGSTFTVNDARSEMRVKQYRIQGNGTIRGDIGREDPSQPWRSKIQVALDPVLVYHRDQQQSLVEGSKLNVLLQSSPPRLGQPVEDPRLLLELDEASISDLSYMNHLLPASLGLKILTGAGAVSGRVELAGDSSSAGLRFSGEVGEAQLGAHRFRTGFETDLKLRGEFLDGNEVFHLDGSSIRLFEARNQQGDAQSPSWGASLRLEQGQIEPWEADQEALPEADETSLESALRLASGEFKLLGEVSDIGFLNPLLGKVEGLRVGGAANLQAQFLVDEGEPATGSNLQLKSDLLTVNYLDYSASGSGGITGELVQGDHRQLLKLVAGLANVAIVETASGRGHVQGAELILNASGYGDKFSDELQDLQVELEIPQASIPDLRVYNDYLPADAGVRLTSGQGEMQAKFLFRDDLVSGQIDLAAAEVEVEVRGRPVGGGIRLSAPLGNGSAKEMVFDIDGVTLHLENLKTLDIESDTAPWSGSARVQQGRVKWKQPLALDAVVQLQMDDSAPLVYLFTPPQKRNGMIGEMLTVRNIRGVARVAAGDRSLVMNDVQIAGEGLDLRAQLQFRNQQTEGMLYAKLGRLAAAVELRDGEPDWKLIGAKKKYDAYPPFPIQLPVLERNQ